MVIKLHFALLFCLLQITYTPLFASKNGLPPDKKDALTDICDAPSPEGFRVAGRGPDFINLAWNSISADVTHTLTVYLKTDSTAWLYIETYNNITGSTFTINDVKFDDEVMLELSADCATGGTSIHKSILTPKIVVELIVGGRVPLNPQPVSCMDIHPNDHEWYGFRVTRTGGGPIESNLYEIEITGNENNPKVYVKRVFDETVIYAVDFWGIWPPPSRTAPNPFTMVKYQGLNGQLIIGAVETTINFSIPMTADICPSPDLTWDENYSFMALVANAVYDGSPPEPHFDEEGRAESISTSNNKTNIKIENPIKETMTIFNIPPTEKNQTVNLRLLTTNGQIVLDQNVNGDFEKIALPVDGLTAGVYLLQVKTNGFVQTLKAVKVN